LKLGAAYEKHDLFFASEVGRPLHYRNLTQRHFEKILERAGLKDAGFVLYNLRHSCATLLLSTGKNPKIVAERLAHTSVKMTLDRRLHACKSNRVFAELLIYFFAAPTLFLFLKIPILK